MAITSTSTPIWHFKGDATKQHLPDPRTAIVRHIQWTKPVYGTKNRGLTDWSVPEPDAYNSALFAQQPIDCPFIKSQVWYYDETRQGWFSVYYIEAEQKLEWARWFINKPWTAHWTVFKQSQLRKTRPMLAERKRSNSEELTLHERLNELNYYSALLNKVEEDAKFSILQRIGET
jgi:hypothetical protein